MSSRTFGVLFSLGCAALTAISWMNSWPALAEGRPWADLGGGFYRPRLEVLQAATLFTLFALYGFVLVRWRQFRLSPRILALMGIAPALLTLGALPANSKDVLFYLGLGRILAIHGANPYSHTYSQFLDDFSSYFGWDLPMPYGPLMLPPLMLSAWLSATNLLFAIFALKLVWLIVHVCNCAVIYNVMKRQGGDAAFGLFLFGFSPLILLEHLANGHNDGLMVLCGLLAIAAVQRGRFIGALLLAFCAALVKIPGLVFWVAILIFLLRQRQLRSAAIGSAICAALVVAMAAVFLGDLDFVMAMTDTGPRSTNSFHHLLIAAVTEYGPRLGLSMGFSEVFSADRLVAGVLLLGFVAWRATYIRTLESLLRELAYLFLALLVGFTVWFQPWYVTWLVPLAALTAADRLRWVIVAYSGSTLALYAFPGYLLTQARFHQVWAAIRIIFAHVPVLALVTRSITQRASGRAARRSARDLHASAEPGTEWGVGQSSHKPPED